MNGQREKVYTYGSLASGSFHFSVMLLHSGWIKQDVNVVLWTHYKFICNVPWLTNTKLIFKLIPCVCIWSVAKIQQTIHEWITE